MRLLLVNPHSGDLTGGLKYLSKVEPLGLEIIGTAVPDHDVELLDMELGTDIQGLLRRFNPSDLDNGRWLQERKRVEAFLELVVVLDDAFSLP